MRTGAVLLLCLSIGVLGLVGFPRRALADGGHESARVLVVNSYHPGYAWSDDIMAGIRSVLGEHEDIEVLVEHLDTKRHVDQAYLAQVERILRHKYEKADIDVIITSDDNALDLILRMRPTFLTRVPLVYCGIDHVDPERIDGQDPIYGVEERDGTRSTLDLALRLHPRSRTAFFVSDDTATGRLMLQNARVLEPAYRDRVAFEYLLDLTTAEMKTALRRVPHDSVVLYLSFIRDRSNAVLSIERSMRLVADAAPVPVYCTWGFQPGTGVLGGDLLTGFSQGERSARIAVRLIRNDDVGAIPRIQEAPLACTFDYPAIHRFGLHSDDLPDGSVVHGKPFSLFEEYTGTALGTLLLILALSGVVAFLLVQRARAKRTQALLADSERRFRATFEQAAVGIAHVHPDGRFERINRKFCDIVGYSREEMLARTFRDITHPEDLETDQGHVQDLLDGKSTTYTMEKRYFRKDGEIVWVALIVSLIRDAGGEPSWFNAVVKDITARKQAEQRLRESEGRLRRLARELTVVEDAERRRIAAELHDQVGQTLAFSRIQLAKARKLAADGPLADILEDVSTGLLEILDDTGQLIQDLGHPTLNEFGLAAALSEWLEEQVRNRHGIEFEFTEEGRAFQLEDDVRAILFRNVRELLTNVIKHADASRVELLLARTADRLEITVSDDGVGLAPERAMTSASTGGFGLFSIRERMRDLGGRLEIESVPGQGCRAILTVPVEGDGAPDDKVAGAGT